MINKRIHEVAGSNTHLVKGTCNEHASELSRKDQEHQHLRGSLLEGLASTPAGPADAAYFEGLRWRVGSHVK